MRWGALISCGLVDAFGLGMIDGDCVRDGEWLLLARPRLVPPYADDVIVSCESLVHGSL